MDLDSLAIEVIEETFPYNRDYYITNTAEDGTTQVPPELRLFAGEIYIRETDKISNDKITPNCVENWLLEIIDPDYQSGSYFYSPDRFIESQNYVKVYNNELYIEYGGSIQEFSSPPQPVQRQNCEEPPNGRGIRCKSALPTIPSSGVQQSAITKLSGLSFRPPDDGHSGHIIFPPIRKDITKYKLYRFLVGSSTMNGGANNDILRLPSERLNQGDLESTAGSDLGSQQWPQVDYDKVRAMRVQNVLDGRNGANHRHSFNGTSPISGTYNNMLFITFNNRRCDRFNSDLTGGQEIWRDSCRQTINTMEDIIHASTIAGTPYGYR